VIFDDRQLADVDPADDFIEEHDLALDERDRFATASLCLVDPAFSSSPGRAIKDAHGAPGERDGRHEQGSPRPLAASVNADSHHGPGQGQPGAGSAALREQRQERAAHAALYGHRSGTVTHLGVRCHHLRVVESDVPFGMTLTDWRQATNKTAASPGATGDAA
jgi:hypothetical protein